MADHAWCHDIARDAAVRAAEDGRDRPLPTLGEAIARPFADAAERSVELSKTGEGQSGMRTERITLEVKHGEPYGVSNWSWVTILRLQSGESVRVVSEEEPRGWLTEEQKQAVRFFADWLDNELRECCEVDRNKSILRNLLARSTPPKVRLPLADLGDRLLRDSVIHALAEAGVEVALPPGPEGDG